MYTFPGTIVLADSEEANLLESVNTKFAVLEERVNLLTVTLQRAEVAGQYAVTPPSPTTTKITFALPTDQEIVLRIPSALLTKPAGDTYYAAKNHTHPPVPSLLVFQDEGTPQGSAGTLNIVGAAASVAVAGGVATLTISGSTLDFQDEGMPLDPASTFNVTGSGATLTSSGGTATLDIPGFTPPMGGVAVLYTTPVNSNQVNDTVGEFIFDTQAQVDGDTLAVGDVLYLIVGGRWGASSTLTNYIWRVYANTGVILSRSMHAYTNPLSEGWFMMCQFTVRAIGASGKVTGNGMVGMDSNDTFSPGTRQMSNLVVEKDIDTTVNNLIKVSLEFSSAPPGTFASIETMSLLRARMG